MNNLTIRASRSNRVSLSSDKWPFTAYTLNKSEIIVLERIRHELQVTFVFSGNGRACQYYQASKQRSY